MELHLTEEIGAADLEEVPGLSIRQVERLFRRHLDQSPIQFPKLLRLRGARASA